MFPQINMQETGKNIRRLMYSRGMSAKDVQNMFGFSTPQAVYKWISGKCLPTVDNLVVLADTFGCTVDSIVVVEMRRNDK